jgi:hypothetical protein
LIFILFVTVPSLMSVIKPEVHEALGYSNRFAISPEEARSNISISKYVSDYIFVHIQTFFLFIFSNPLVFGANTLILGFTSYIATGTKAFIVGPCLMSIMIFQLYYKKISTKKILILFPLGIIFLAFLIGTTSFRGSLSLKSLMTLELPTIISKAEDFLTGAESRHIIYTADIIERLDKGEITYRYGFDLYRIIIYPFKEFFDDFRYASYVEYAALLNGKLVNGGHYLGLAGELYWNFGIFFFIFSYLMGHLLKRFTNYAFSLKPFGMITYLILITLVTWRFYRGSVSDLVMISSLYFTSAIIFFVFLKILGLKFPQFGCKLVKAN